MPGQALEVAQHLESGDTQAALRTASIAAASPSGWPAMSRAWSMIWLKPASRTARSFASSGPASVIVSIPN
jgi:hypothetical protein